MLYDKFRRPEFWAEIARDPAYADWIGQVKTEYETLKLAGPSPVTYTQRRYFYETGNRNAMEGPYFQRRSFLAQAAMLSLLFPDCKEYLDTLQDLIWLVCEEFNWILPAHCPSPVSRDRYVDLFCTETGATLSEICWYLAERLDPDVKTLVSRNLKEKLFDPFEQNTYPWEKMPMNWNAVCNSQMAIAMLCDSPELFDKYTPRFNRNMEVFLSGFPEDGSCLEGVGYWQYGFGRFLYYADALYARTDGSADLLDSDIVRSAAAYAPKCILKGDTLVSFSDGFRRFGISESIAQYIADRCGAPLLPDAFRSFGGRWMELLRCFLFARPGRKAEPLPRRDYYFREGCQLFINRDRYSLALKAGFNDEPHNHNDIGSFIISGKEGQLLCDIGSGEYTRQYFQRDTRYGFLCNSSEGHSVPVIDGCYQKAGREYTGTLTYEGGSRAELEIAGAYGLEQLTGLTRTFEWTDSSVTVRDSFRGSFRTATERFVTLLKPRYENGTLFIGSLEAKAPACSISVREHLLHNLSGIRRNTEPVYIIDFPLAEGQTEFAITFEVTP